MLNSGQPNELHVHEGDGWRFGWTRVVTGPLVEGSGRSYGGLLIDYTGDGSADDVVLNYGQPNELHVHAGGGTWTRVAAGPLVEGSGASRSGLLIDYTGDRSADDVLVMNYGQPNELRSRRFCADGYFSTRIQCQSCPTGKMSNEIRGGCDTCPPGRTSTVGVANCSMCAATYYTTHGDTNQFLCQTCPLGAVCPDSTIWTALAYPEKTIRPTTRKTHR